MIQFSIRPPGLFFGGHSCAFVPRVFAQPSPSPFMSFSSISTSISVVGLNPHLYSDIDLTIALSCWDHSELRRDLLKCASSTHTFLCESRWWLAQLTLTTEGCQLMESSCGKLSKNTDQQRLGQHLHDRPNVGPGSRQLSAKCPFSCDEWLHETQFELYCWIAFHTVSAFLRIITLKISQQVVNHLSSIQRTATTT